MEDVDQKRQELLDKSILLLNEMDKRKLEQLIIYLDNERYIKQTPPNLR